MRVSREKGLGHNTLNNFIIDILLVKEKICFREREREREIKRFDNLALTPKILPTILPIYKKLKQKKGGFHGYFSPNQEHSSKLLNLKSSIHYIHD